MGREVRMVPANWEHPKDERGRFISLHGRSWSRSAAEWDEEKAKWDAGEFPSYADEEARALPFEEWSGKRPEPSDYMPEWSPEEATHYRMYETTTEGTPISPAFATPEELARWLADNGASAFGRSTASYEAWLRVAGGGWAPSAVATNGHVVSGVEGLTPSEAGTDAEGG